MKTAAIYARVSSDKQKEENTIASQTSALIAFAREQNCDGPTEWVIEDDGYSGASLLRPGLERVRDLAAEGRIQAVIVYAPDRLSRRYAHQILLIEEFARAGVDRDVNVGRRDQAAVDVDAVLDLNRLVDHRHRARPGQDIGHHRGRNRRRGTRGADRLARRDDVPAAVRPGAVRRAGRA